MAVGLAPNFKNYLCYNLSLNEEYKTNFNILEIGPPRIGKSTLAYDLSERILAFKWGVKYLNVAGEILKRGFLIDNYVYTNEQPIRNLLLKNPGQPKIVDEAFFNFDKRLSMTNPVIESTSALNKYASALSITFILMQEQDELDKRIVKAMDLVFYLSSYSTAYLYARPKALGPLLRVPYSLFNFDFSALRAADKTRLDHQFKSFPEYIHKISWHNKDRDIGFAEYLKYKAQKQQI